MLTNPKDWNFKLQDFGMYQNCSFKDAISQKSIYLICHQWFWLDAIVYGFTFRVKVLLGVTRSHKSSQNDTKAMIPKSTVNTSPGYPWILRVQVEFL